MLTEEIMTRILVALVCIGMLTIRIPFVLRARRGMVKTKVIEPFWVLLLILAILPGGLLVACYVFGIKPPVGIMSFGFHRYSSWAAIIIQANLLVDFYAIHAQLGQNFSSTLVVRRNHCLMTTGHYKMVRHPLYMVVLLFCLLLVPAMNQLLPGMVIFVGLLFFFLHRIRREEAMLMKEFPDYLSYSKRTWRLMPYIW